jgi:NitT/TauT family transport system permease protein
MSEKINNNKGFNIKFDYRTIIPTIVLLITVLIDLIPNHEEAKYRNLTTFRDFIIILIGVSILVFIIGLFNRKVRDKYSYQSFFIGGILILINIINVVTVKLMLLPQIYFPSLNRILNVYLTDYEFLLTCLASSFKLLLEGLLIGAVVGIVCGILIGWSKQWNYWIYPVIRILGPIPSSTWLPLALIIFPSSRYAAIFIIAFGVWFQMTILTSSGIQSVKKSYFEVSSTLGATNLQNLFLVAIPDSLPSIFLGFFNATTTSFVALMSAEMMGVKAGIGWYINWQKEMVSYPNVFAGLIVIAFFCYLVITVQFKVRDRLLGWQKGVIKW